MTNLPWPSKSSKKSGDQNVIIDLGWVWKHLNLLYMGWMSIARFTDLFINVIEFSMFLIKLSSSKWRQTCNYDTVSCPRLAWIEILISDYLVHSSWRMFHGGTSQIATRDTVVIVNAGTEHRKYDGSWSYLRYVGRSSDPPLIFFGWTPILGIILNLSMLWYIMI